MGVWDGRRGEGSGEESTGQGKGVVGVTARHTLALATVQNESRGSADASALFDIDCD